VTQADDIKAAHCHHCGLPAKHVAFGTGSFGVCRTFLCTEHYREARELCRRFLEITGLEHYSVPPHFRPDRPCKPQ